MCNAGRQEGVATRRDARLSKAGQKPQQNQEALKGSNVEAAVKPEICIKVLSPIINTPVLFCTKLDILVDACISWPRQQLACLAL